ncbi:hypothetical protein [Streptomyces solicathayae]|uniref:Integral membrane protein n=1 Tax=Streptomyces solicathayae TaxID=3081768 RepID=A0ABZ0LW91_9ACTN|nr:hypothetical protein [Streptomyces sp. HUAS YS2]WOX23771.1 hypothetical protein R2D22_21235 [Streptomyces sp. HUAS YS2]
MSEGTNKTVVHLVATLVTAVVAAGLWAAWLGWDQQRDVHPDGSVSGPYEAWQVIGLGVTLLVATYGTAAMGWFVAAVLGTTAGLTVAAFADWSDDASGLFVIGVGMIAVGSMVGTTAVTAAAGALRQKRA